MSKILIANIRGMMIRRCLVSAEIEGTEGSSGSGRALISDRRSTMPRRAAKVTQADIARALRAAKNAGASEVTVDAEGKIRIALTGRSAPDEPQESNDTAWTPSEALKRHLNSPESG